MPHPRTLNRFDRSLSGTWVKGLVWAGHGFQQLLFCVGREAIGSFDMSPPKRVPKWEGECKGCVPILFDLFLFVEPSMNC